MIDADVAVASSRSASPKNIYEHSPMVQAAERREMHVDVEGSSSCAGRFVLASVLATLGPLCFGYCLGYSSPAVEDFTNTTDPGILMSGSDGSWFSSILAIGAIVGSIIGGWTVEALGRRGTIMVCSIPFVLGWMLITGAKNHAMLFSGRVITGIGTGMVSLAVPVYIAEISTASCRGILGSGNQLAVTIGIVLAYVFGLLCSWRWLAVIGVIPPTLLVLSMYFMPETPRWSVSHNKRKDALEALRWLRGPEADIDEECHKIEATLDNNVQMTLAEFCQPSVAKPLIISLALMFFQQFCGINPVVFNCASIFSDAGFKNGKLVSIYVGCVQVLGTLLACVVMDRAGRRVLLLLGEAAMFISLLGLGFYFELAHVDGKDWGTFEHSIDSKNIQWLSIASVILFIFAFSLSWGPIPWLVMSEVFPLRARGRSSSIATFFNWLLVFIVTKTFRMMLTNITHQGTYWFYAGCCFLGFLFVFAFMPETKGKTLEEIELLFDNKRVPYQPID